MNSSGINLYILGLFLENPYDILKATKNIY